jgi:hypothetical protein
MRVCLSFLRRAGVLCRLLTRNNDTQLAHPHIHLHIHPLYKGEALIVFVVLLYQ